MKLTTNTGYGIHFDYDPSNVMALVKATAWNMAVETCAPTAVTCSFAQTWPAATYLNGMAGPTSITDAAGVTTTFTYTDWINPGGYYLTSIKKPSGWTETFHYAPPNDCTSQNGCYNLTSVDYGAGAGTWTYTSATTRNDSSQTGNIYDSVLDPYAGISTLTGGGGACLLPAVQTDALGRSTTYLCDQNFSKRITKVTLPGELGHLLSEKFTSNSALNLSYSYDALGRKLTQTGPLGTVTSTWDPGGRRTRLTWPGTDVSGGFFIT